MSAGGYPNSIVEVLDDGMKFRKGAIRTLRTFKAHVARNRLRGYRDPQIVLRRYQAMRWLVQTLALVYRIPVPELRLGRITGERGSSGISRYIPGANVIVLEGRLSVLTLLHELAHARGMDERKAVRWSVNLYRRVYPRHFEKLMERNGGGLVGHFLSA
ncbi:MAG: hypothetical protein ACNS63_04415 [Candidatus Nitrospinota bacterium M3_3B_026]